jgi:hypothetical protein
VLDPTVRMTAQQAMAHPWLAAHTVSTSSNSSSATSASASGTCISPQVLLPTMCITSVHFLYAATKCDSFVRSQRQEHHCIKLCSACLLATNELYSLHSLT